MNNEDNQNKRFKQIFIWATIFITGIFTSYYLFTLVTRDYDHIIKEHFSATVGLPLGAIAAFCIVYFFEYNSGDIEFEGLGFKFKGAAGPIVFWLFCFLSIVLGIKLLW